MKPYNIKIKEKMWPSCESYNCLSRYIKTMEASRDRSIQAQITYEILNSNDMGVSDLAKKKIYRHAVGHRIIRSHRFP